MLFALMLIFSSCSNKKNTSFSRFYHSVNTRYNAHFNANEAYKESMKQKERSQEESENLSQILHVYPMILDSSDLKYQGTFTTTIDKTTKAIKLHSIKTKPPRDPNKRRDEKYQQWIKQQEFNPFLINTWMLLAKAEFEEGNYLRAITTFMYISKIYSTDKKIVSESKLWIARSYSEMGWMYEAENVLRKMEQNDEIHHQLLGMYASVKANIYVHNKNYESAIPYLEEAIRKEKGFQKRRNRFLLGQLYESLGENQKAYTAYGKVKGYNSPYHYSFNAQLRQLEISGQPSSKLISSLKKMAKGTKNEEYLDQVYTAMGNVYLNQLDTLEAIKHFELGIKKSKRNGYDQALAQIRVGGLYFDRQEYVKAQPHYSEALPQLKKADEYYSLVSLRSEVLDQLVMHAKVVNEQDSLLNVANMPEFERTAYIEKHIEEVKKEEAKRKKEEALDRLEEQRGFNDNESLGWDDLESNVPRIVPTNTGFGQQKDDGSDFYFYNTQAVEQGKITFQKRWGRRPLEDNWRRKSKETSSPFGDDEEELLAEEKEKTEEETEGLGDKQTEGKKEEVTDKYSVEYYLQQLPLTDEAKVEAGKLVEKGLFNMGLIYKNLLEDKQLAIATFEENLTRFPDTPNKEEIYYQLFLIYLQLDNLELMANYRNKIIEEFPKGKYTTPLSDANYAWNFKYMSKQQEEVYQETYAAYMSGNVQKVRSNYEDIQTKFPFVDLMPKFVFLNALSYAQTKDAKSMEQNLTKLIKDYPKSDVIPLATNILKNIKDGKIILSDGSPISGMDWTMAYANDSIFEGEQTRVVEYITDLDKPHVLLLMFKPKSIDRNELLYEVADYNFSNYVIQTYDLKFDDDPILSSLEINGFKNFKAIQSYINKALSEGGLFENLDKDIIPVPISTNNYREMFPRLGLEEYMTFYGDSLSTATPQLLAYWGKDIDMELVADLSEDRKYEPEITQPIEKTEEIVVPEKEVAQEKEETVKETTNPVEEVNEKEVNLEELLTEEQLNILGNINQKTDDFVESINNLGSNPVEGLKNLFGNKNKFEENLTKEEKEELKREKKEAKERQKAVQKILKAKQDSIAKVEKFKLDSIQRAEKAVEDSIQNATKLAKQKLEFERKERDRIAKEEVAARKRQQQDKEQARKDQLKQREEQRKQQEKERDEKLRERERQRDEMVKQREQERKAKEKAAEELRKQKEKERQELMKQREQEVKNRRK